MYKLKLEQLRELSAILGIEIDEGKVVRSKSTGEKVKTNDRYRKYLVEYIEQPAILVNDLKRVYEESNPEHRA